MQNRILHKQNQVISVGGRLLVGPTAAVDMGMDYRAARRHENDRPGESTDSPGAFERPWARSERPAPESKPYPRDLRRRLRPRRGRGSTIKPGL